VSASPHPFAYRDFTAYWVSRLCSTVAQNCLVIVVGWQVYDHARLTMDTRHAALQLGLVGLAQFLPLFALALITGWTADRVDRRFIARSTTGLQLLCAVILGTLTYTGAVTLPALFFVAALLGVARAFSMPATTAMAPNLVPPEALPRAIAAGALAGRVGGILGPALGGYLYAVAPHVPYSVSAVLYVISIAALMLVGPLPRSSMDRSRNPWRQMVEGLAYVFENKLVLGAISLDLFAVLLGGATAMLPIYARDILHVGPEGLGHLRAAPAVGAVITAIWFSWRPLRHNVGIKMLACVAVFGAATVAFGLSRSMPFSLACLVVLGASDMLSVYVRQSLIALSTPDEMRGRVGAVSSLFISASNELGEAESGFLAAAVGPVVAVVAGGFGAVAITLLWAKWFPALRLAKNFELVKREPASP
jgi:MFS family permease